MSRFQVINGSLMPIAGMQIAEADMSETSEGSLQNKTITQKFEEVDDFINDQVNILGAKNLLTYPYSTTTKVHNGITFTDNGDGTVTVDGTATANAYFAYAIYSNPAHNLEPKLQDGVKYILSGCPAGGSDTTYYQAYQTIDGVGDAYRDTGDGVELVKSTGNRWWGIYIMAGTTVSNLTFKPMLRPASVKDDIWTPYAMDNIALTSGLLQVNNLLKVKTIPITWTKPSGVYMDYNDRQSYCFLCGTVGILFFAARIGLPEADTFYDVASIPAQYIKSFYDRKSTTQALSYNQVGIIQNNVGKPLPSSGYWCVRLNTATGIISTSCTVAAAAAGNRFVVATITFACN